MIHKIAGVLGTLAHSVTCKLVTWFYLWILLNCPSLRITLRHRLLKILRHYDTSDAINH